MSTLRVYNRQPEPTKILVEEYPVQEGTKLSESNTVNPELSWHDVAGLSWIILGKENEVWQYW